jgi:hypothetical protein
MFTDKRAFIVAIQDSAAVRTALRTAGVQVVDRVYNHKEQVEMIKIHRADEARSLQALSKAGFR